MSSYLIFTCSIAEKLSQVNDSKNYDDDFNGSGGIFIAIELLF
jgi:hypothetical protein